MRDNNDSLSVVYTEKNDFVKRFLTRGQEKVKESKDIGDFCHQLVTYAELSRLIISCPWLEITDKRGIADILFARLNQMTCKRPDIPEPVIPTPPF